MDKLLWTYKDIAEQFGYSTRYIRDTIMKDPDAPAPAFPGRFRPSDVRQFLNVVQARRQQDYSRPSRAGGPSTRTSGKDQEH
jgi:hypothetical protein